VECAGFRDDDFQDALNAIADKEISEYRWRDLRWRLKAFSEQIGLSYEINIGECAVGASPWEHIRGLIGVAQLVHLLVRTHHSNASGFHDSALICRSARAVKSGCIDRMVPGSCEVLLSPPSTPVLQWRNEFV
jgi:hypothetical protein